MIRWTAEFDADASAVRGGRSRLVVPASSPGRWMNSRRDSIACVTRAQQARHSGSRAACAGLVEAGYESWRTSVTS